MAVGFRAVNSHTVGPVESPAMATSSDAPRLDEMNQRSSGSRQISHDQQQPSSPSADRHMEDARTPTQSTFSSSATQQGQRPLPSSPFPPSTSMLDHSDKSAEGTIVAQSGTASLPGDAMDESDGEHVGVDDGAGSDNDSVNADGTRSGKKKRSQRFFCTEFPPCNLSFTRSEHLARHIRYVSDFSHYGPFCHLLCPTLMTTIWYFSLLTVE
jgi:hypothetical protein